MARIITQLIIDAANRTRRAFDEVRADVGKLDSLLGKSGKALAGYFALSTLKGAVSSVVERADAYQLMSSRLKLAAGSQQSFNIAQAELQRLAVKSGAPISSLVTLYTRLAQPMKEAGRSQADLIKLIDAVSLSFQISGASTAEAEGAIVQFSQAMGAGALRGAEFNSVAEQAPRLMQALADGLGVPRGALKDLAAEGKLTADVVTAALIGQLPKIQAEFSSIATTVGNEMTKLGDTINRGIGNADTGPLRDAIVELRKTLEDPKILDNLTTLASLLLKVAEGAVRAGSSVVTLGEEIGFLGAQLSGNLDEVDRADKQIARLESSINGVGAYDLLFSDEGLKQNLKEWQDYRASLLEVRTGMTEDARTQAENMVAQLKEIEEARHEGSLAAERAYIDSIKTIRDQQVTDREASIKREEAAEKKAVSALKAVRDSRLEIEKRYKDALAGLNTTSEASYSSAQSLKIGAKQALKAGDLASAQAQAKAALQMLQDLAQAGENTYGFSGIVKELQGIELAANDIEQSQAEQKIKEIRDSVTSLKDEAAKLADLPISFNLDQAGIDNIKAQIQALSKIPIFIPVKLEPTDGMNTMGLMPGAPLTFPATAVAPVTVQAQIEPVGVRQDGVTTLPPVAVDVVPKGVQQDGTALPAVEVEVIPKIRQDGENSWTDLPPAPVTLELDQSAAAVAQQKLAQFAANAKQQLIIPVVPVYAGADGAPAEPAQYASGGRVRGPGTGTSDSILARLSNGEFVLRAAAVKRFGLNALERMNGLQMPAFADGGFVSAAESVAVGGGAVSRGVVNLTLPSGESYSMYADADQFDRLLKDSAAKFGGTQARR